MLSVTQPPSTWHTTVCKLSLHVVSPATSLHVAHYVSFRFMYVVSHATSLHVVINRFRIALWNVIFHWNIWKSLSWGLIHLDRGLPSIWHTKKHIFSFLSCHFEFLFLVCRCGEGEGWEGKGLQLNITIVFTVIKEVSWLTWLRPASCGENKTSAEGRNINENRGKIRSGVPSKKLVRE